MNVFLRILIGLGAVASILIGLMLTLGGGLLGGSLFTLMGCALVIAGVFGCVGAFSNNKTAAGISCFIMLFGWVVSWTYLTVYAVICLVMLYIDNIAKEENKEQTQDTA